MTSDSFTYNGKDMYQMAKLKIIAYDVFSPPLRKRKTTVPFRSGTYKGRAKYHEERLLKLQCILEGEITDAQFDDLKYTLSREGRIMLWDQTDRYFLGQMFDSIEVLDYYRHCMREFELVFECDPYKYGLQPMVWKTTQNVLKINDYIGTREAFTRITLQNKGTAPISNLKITARERS